MFTKELTVALKAAETAGKILANYFGTDFNVEYKSKDQPVTVADREANEAIKKIILGAFPDDGWLSEETRDNPDRLGKKRVWIVDPLDGTKEFIQKVAEFAISIALVVESQPVVGVILNPVTAELYHVVKQQGAFLNGKPLRVTEEGDLTKARIFASRSELGRGEWEPFRSSFLIRPSGGMAYKMAQVAEGKAEGSFSLQPKNEWDIAAGVLLIAEGGGIVTQLDGCPFSFNKPNPREKGLIYGNPKIHRQLLATLSKI